MWEILNNSIFCLNLATKWRAMARASWEGNSVVYLKAVKKKNVPGRLGRGFDEVYGRFATFLFAPYTSSLPDPFATNAFATCTCSLPDIFATLHFRYMIF